MKTTRVCQATADSHAAGLTKTDPVDTQTVGGATADPGTTAIWSANLSTTETDIVTGAAVDVTGSPNFVYLCASCIGQKITAAGTITLRIKEGAATLFTFVSASIAAGNTYGFRVSGVLTNATVALHTYKMSAQASTNGQQVLLGHFWTMVAYSALSGSAGTCL